MIPFSLYFLIKQRILLLDCATFSEYLKNVFFFSFTSTFSTCLAVCKQELIVSRCGCRSSALPELTSLTHVPYCGQVPDWREMLNHRGRYNRSQHLPALDCEETVMERLKNDRGWVDG